MSKLIQLRQRIKAIETIKKITHAMRLIAMSSHSRLKHKQEPLSAYTQELNELFAKLIAYAPHWTHPIIHPKQSPEQSILVILVGSQKGLCGGFNSHLFKQFDAFVEQNSQKKIDVVAVGLKAVEFMRDKKNGMLKHSYEKFAPARLNTIAHEIVHTIMHSKKPYGSVILLSNIFKSFFVQKPSTAILIPMPQEAAQTTYDANQLHWEQTAPELLDSLVTQYLEGQLYFLLFQSLLAEQAARFISMDSATRNAEKLLTAAKLDFNKLRQAKITKELTELVGSY